MAEQYSVKIKSLSIIALHNSEIIVYSNDVGNCNALLLPFLAT